MYYDVDTEVPAGRVLVENDRDGQDIWALTVSLDHTTNPFEFDLAIELAKEDELFTHSSIPRKIAVWRVSSRDNDSLSAEPTCSFSVFRESSVHESLSMYGYALLRVSYSSSHETVFTLHRWQSPQGGVVSHSILLPQTSSPSADSAKLLPDGRIIAISNSKVELYNSAEHPWEESPTIPDTLPRIAPQWVFNYEPPPEPFIYVRVSRFLEELEPGVVVFSLKSGGSIFRFRILRANALEPEVTEFRLKTSIHPASFGLGAPHVLAGFSSSGSQKMILAILWDSWGPWRLGTFAGVTNVDDSENNSEALERTLKLPLSHYAGYCEVDEVSGRVLWCIEMRERRSHFAVLHFV
ncbi:hypothetical protein FS837_007820 [Tulasnella sp. UAMH 9824]|nr:hypothetical protein FS837_007820 [Tulasnella sp. UAMH 9824]